MDLIEPEVYLWGQLSLTTSSVNYKVGSLATGGSLAEVKHPSENCSKRLFMTKSNFEKVAARRVVSWEFSVISKDSHTSKWLLTSFLLVC